jgi:hypothetical protein
MLTALRVGAQLGTRAVETVAPTFTEWMASRSLALVAKAAERTGFGESAVARWSAALETRVASRVSETAEPVVDLGRRKFLSYGGTGAAVAALNPVKLMGGSLIEFLGTERLLMAGVPITAASRAAAFNPYVATLSPASAGSAIRAMIHYVSKHPATAGLRAGTVEFDMATGRAISTIGMDEARAVHEVFLQTEGLAERAITSTASRLATRPTGPRIGTVYGENETASATRLTATQSEGVSAARLTATEAEPARSLTFSRPLEASQTRALATRGDEQLVRIDKAGKTAGTTESAERHVAQAETRVGQAETAETAQHTEKTADLSRRNFLSLTGSGAAAAALHKPLKAISMSTAAPAETFIAGTHSPIKVLYKPIGQRASGLRAHLELARVPESVIRHIEQMGQIPLQAKGLPQLSFGRAVDLLEKPAAAQIAQVEQQVSTQAVRRATASNVEKAAEHPRPLDAETHTAIDSLAKNSAVRNGANAERTEIEAQIR